MTQGTDRPYIGLICTTCCNVGWVIIIGMQCEDRVWLQEFGVRRVGELMITAGKDNYLICRKIGSSETNYNGE